MIIARSPLRVSLGGGGTDLPSYYLRHGGFVIAGAINRYVYVTINRRFFRDILLKYSKLELVSSVDEIEHPVIREALRMMDVAENLEITSMADIPAGTGLGSSGSFCSALLKALNAYQKHVITLHELAEQACEIEITKLGEPVGKQDPYIAAFGGIRCFQFERDGGVKTERLRISADTLCDLEENLLLFFTGYSRSAGDVLKEQDERSRQNEEGVLGYLHHVKELGLCSKRLLEEGDVQGFGELMNDHWESKRRFNERMTNADIDRWHDIAMKNGAVGGKLVGAGSGGFLMFYAVDRARLRQALRREGLEEVRFQFDFEGTKILVA